MEGPVASSPRKGSFDNKSIKSKKSNMNKSGSEGYKYRKPPEDPLSSSSSSSSESDETNDDAKKYRRRRKEKKLPSSTSSSGDDKDDDKRYRKKKKGKKKRSKYSGPSKFSGDELASVRSSNIGPGVSTSTLVAWAEKKYKLFKKELEKKRKANHSYHKKRLRKSQGQG